MDRRAAVSLATLDATQQRPMVVLAFQNCYVRIWNGDFLETVFPGEASAPALFLVTDETQATALATGYGQDVRRMHLEHELGHTFLSEQLGRPYSYVLKRVADGEPWSFDPLRAHEEQLVLAFQTYLNTGAWDDVLLMLNGVEDVAATFRERFGWIPAALWPEKEAS